ncbi:MAG: recombination mediator RecR [Kiritimatiellae bacterium]|nr:recombination mediator RecR [Kiritimatiellia bacterium]
MVPQIDCLIRALSKLPGLGRRSAERAALALLRKPDTVMDGLIGALREARADVCCCSVCGGFTARDRDPCALCSDASRDGTLLCVVEEPSDIFAIERSGGFRGRYHALLGKLSPSRQTGPGDLRLKALADRVTAAGGIREVLLALSTDMEGDATAGYIGEMLKGSGARVTRLAFGLPADSGVGYSDPLTLKRAISGRVSCD